MPQPNDLSRSLVALDQDSTIIAVVEMSQSSWLVGGVLPGIERQPCKKLEPSAERLLGLLHRWRDEAVRAGKKITRIALAFEAGPRRLLVGALAECARGGGACHPSLECRSIAATSPGKDCSAAIWMGKRDNQDGNPGSRHWHDCRGVTVAQGGLRICIVAARRSGIGRGCRVDRRAAATSLSFERGTAAVAFDVHLEDGGMIDEAVDNSDSHCLVWEDFAPFAERLVGSDEDGSPLITDADEFEKHAGFGLVFGDVGEVIEDQEVEFVELGNGGFEKELAAGDLEPLDEIGGAGKQYAPAIFDKGEAKRCREMALAAARGSKQQ